MSDLFYCVLFNDLIPHQDNAMTGADAVRSSVEVVEWYAAHEPAENLLDPSDVGPFLQWVRDNFDALAAAADLTFPDWE